MKNKTQDKRAYMREYMRKRYHADIAFRAKIIQNSSNYQKKKRVKVVQKNDYAQHLNSSMNKKE